MVCNGPSPALSAHRWSVNRIFYCDAIIGGSWPWRLDWPRFDDAEPRPTDRFAVLRCSTSAAYRTSPSINFSVSVAHFCTRSFPIGLLQQCPVWTPYQPHPVSPICSERCGSVKFHNSTVSWLQLQLLSLVLFAEYCWFYSFLSSEFYTVEMFVFLCLRISASSIWNFSRFGVFYWYFVQFSAWGSVNRIAVYHATPFLPSTTHAVVQHWTGKPVTSSAAYDCVGVAVVLGNTVDAKRLQPVQWRHQPAVLRKSPQYSVTGALSITITTSISCFPGDEMSVPQYWKLFNAVR